MRDERGGEQEGPAGQGTLGEGTRTGWKRGECRRRTSQNDAHEVSPSLAAAKVAVNHGLDYAAEKQSSARLSSLPPLPSP